MKWSEVRGILRERIINKAKSEGWSKDRLQFTLTLLDGVIQAAKVSGKEGVVGYIAGKIGEVTGGYIDDKNLPTK